MSADQPTIEAPEGEPEPLDVDAFIEGLDPLPQPPPKKLNLKDCPYPHLLVAAGIGDGAINITTMLRQLPWFKHAADWSAWRACLCAIYGLPMSEQDRDMYERCTGRKEPPTAKAREVWIVAGRRSRKTAIGALLGVWEGLQDWTRYLAPGERALIPMMSKSLEDARQLRDFVVAILQCPALRAFMDGEPKAQEVNLVTRVDLRIRAVSLTAGRSRSVPLALLDEQAFWPSDESAVPDEEVVAGIRPAQAHLPGALLVGLSSPYARRGLMWKAYREHYASEGDPVLVWKASTIQMHDTPKLREYVQIQMEADPAAARGEYLAEFRTDIADLVSEEMVRACVVNGRTQVPAQPGIAYWAGVDVSGGSSDSMTLAIAHWQKDRVVLDYACEAFAPFNPDDVVAEHAMVLKGYGIRTVAGDRYGGEWPVVRYRAHGITYYPADEAKSQLYLSFLPLLSARTVELLDSKRIVSQLTGLERKTSRSGKDLVDHRPGGMDDLVNACAIACTMAGKLRRALPAPKKPEMNTREEFMANLHRMTKPRTPARGQNIYRRAR